MKKERFRLYRFFLVFIRNLIELWKLWLVTLFYLVGSGIALYYIETTLFSHSSEQSNTITTLGEAFYVTFISFTTIGFGDKYPMSSIGRIISIVNGFFGLIIFGVIVWIVIQTFYCKDPEVIEIIEE